MLKLKVIIGSTRPGRVGLPVGEWFYELAKQHEGFEVELLDLAKINLPFMDEPNHPLLHQYTKQHTKDWSTKIDDGDAFVFITPEYNFGMVAPMKNAIDYLHQEWQYKPVGFVSYGGLAGGTRAEQMLKQVVTTLNMMPIYESVNLPFVKQYMDEQNNFHPTDKHIEAANFMLDALLKWATTLQSLRPNSD